ncbi:Cna B-type domain-containing protein [Actinomyces faecalis]|uniref:Cna B-type domain-containing protein n=1 Tax=Actinomyces faecalis TaxID=2722820 RepID=UPI001551ED39|nr:Cna B-type domain-containing protein [Actinomyces faecalis]
MTIGTLNSDNSITTDKTEFYTYETISQVVDLDISGKDYTLNNPYLVVRLPQTAKLEKLAFVDSTAAKTDRGTEDGYQYVKYSFPSLTGGQHFTFPLTFDFDGRYARNGDVATIEAVLYDGDGSVVQQVSQTYTAKTVGLSGYSYASTFANTGAYIDSLNGKPLTAGQTADGHHGTVTVDVSSESVTTLPSERVLTYYLSANVSDSPSGNYGLEIPGNVKAVMTLPQGVTVKDPIAAVKTETLPDGRQRVTVIETNPSFTSSDSRWTRGRTSEYIGFSDSNRTLLAFNGVPLNTDLPILIDYYRDAEADGSGGTLIASRNETVLFSPRVFEGDGTFGVERSGRATYSHPSSAIASNRYAHTQGRYYSGAFEVTDTGLGLRSRFFQTNNGAGLDSPFEAGVTNSIKELQTSLTSDKLTYNSVKVDSSFSVTTGKSPSGADKAIVDRNIAAANAAFNNGNTTLIGIRADGSEVLIKDNVQLGETIAIPQGNEREFTKIAFRFAEPIVFDNIQLYTWDYLRLITSEQEALDNQDSATARLYNSSATITVASGTSATTSDVVEVAPLAPQAHQFPTSISKKSILSAAGGVPVDMIVGPYWSTRQNFGPIPAYTGTKVITLLPNGVSYEGFSRYNNPANVPPPAVTTVDNYKGTGRTAVIADYGDVPFNVDAAIRLNLRVSQYTARGNNDIPVYMTWTNNDVVKPFRYSSPTSPGSYAYADALDLDGDGDTTELFHKVQTSFSFTPALELTLSKAVRYDGDTGEYSMATTADIDSSVTYKINIFNNAITPVRKIEVIDVLPYSGDHTIVANEAGSYPSRNSTYPNGLRASLESVNSSEVNAQFTFFYLTSPQGADLASVRDGSWVTADKISDFSTVKAVKAVLKENQEIASKGEVNILVPATVPNDPTLMGVSMANPDQAVNTTAYSQDGRVFSEANAVKVLVGTYEITGIYFTDKNNNGVYDAGVDGVRPGQELTLLDKDGRPVTGPDGRPITMTTDKDGRYTVTVYQRGTYTVSATRDNTVTFQSQTGTGAEGNNLDPATISDTGTSALTSAVTVNPATITQHRNIAVREVPGSVTINKTKDAEEGSGPLAGATFRIRTTDGKPVISTNGTEIADVTSDTNGKAVFDKVPLGTYTVTEVSAPIGYVKDPSAKTAVLTPATPDITLDVVNGVAKVNVPVTKVWSDDSDRDGLRPPAVTVHLLADGEDTGQTLTLSEANSWKGTFTNLVEYQGATPVAYTVSEDAVTGYTTAVTGTQATGYTITNTHKIATRAIAVSKVWSDGENQDGLRTDSVTVNLLADGQPTGKSLELSASNGWRSTFSNLPVNQAGQAIAYTVSEDAVTGYTTTVAGSMTNGFTVTNTHIPQVRDVKVTKAWQDADNQDGIRPGSVVVSLLADGEDTGKRVTLDEAGQWNATFSGLARFKAGKEIVYTVSEQDVSGYTSSISGDATVGYTITNSHAPATIDLPVLKTWVDNNDAKGLRPSSVTLRLQADGADAGKTLTLTSADSWRGSFTGLPTYKPGAQGQPVSYTVTEEAVTSYATTYGGTQDRGYTVTNTIEGKVSVTASKVWSGIDPDAAPAVTVNLLANGTTVDSAVLDGNAAGGSWTRTFADLDRYSGGVEIEYTIEEAGVSNATLTAGGHDYAVAVTQGETEHSWVITNTMDNPTLTVDGTTVWVDADNQDGKRPDTVTVELTRNGEPTGTTVTVTTDSDGGFSFPDLPTYDSKGKPITYGVTQVGQIEEYSTEVSGDMTKGFTVTNTHEVAKTSVKATTTWVDADNQDGIRPESVIVRLFADGEDTGQTLTLSPDENGVWSATFEDLDVYKVGAVGQLVTYTVVQDGVEEYETQTTGDAADGFLFTNIHEVSKRTVTVGKVWDDAGDKDGLQPASVTIHLLADGVDTEQSVELNADNGWTASFADLDVNEPGKQGHKLTYTVSEAAVTGYVTQEVSGSMEDGYTVTNTLIRGGITLTKVNQSGSPLAGAVFELRDAQGEVVGTVTSDADGMVTFSALAYGTYTVSEAQAPSGYEKADWSQEVVIDTAGQVIDLGTVTNKAISATRLSKTGTNTLIGLVAMSMLAAGGLLVVRRRRA